MMRSATVSHVPTVTRDFNGFETLGNAESRGLIVAQKCAGGLGVSPVGFCMHMGLH